MATLQWVKASTKILAKYVEYVKVFSSNLAMELSEITGMNEYAIEMVDGKQPLYRPIYALNPVELEILKAYI